MTTKQEKIAAFKVEYPTLKTGSDEAGYTQLSAEDYEATIAKWADNELAAEAELAKAKELATAKSDAIEKLTALGIDPKALGLEVN